MKQEINYRRYVDRYLDGVMNMDEKSWFEKELIDNNELQQEVRMQQNILRSIAQKEVLNLKAQLDNIHDNLYNPKVSSRKISPSFSKRYVVACSIAASLLFGAFLLIHNVKQGETNKELYAQYFSPIKSGSSFRSLTVESNDVLRNAMTEYENKRYHEAIPLFETILENDNSRIGLNLYAGISHMEIKEYKEANIRFKKVIDHKANAFIESAEWYLGLSYLASNNIENARSIFIRIAGSDGYYTKDAKRLLRKLKE